MSHALTSASRVAVLAVGAVMSDAWRAGRWREFMKNLLDPYHPERHYMRGPGPKWREKHGIGDPC